VDLRTALPEVFSAMVNRLHELGRGVYQADINGTYATAACANALHGRCGGFWCPWMD
jgi:hypothetical protein